MGTLKKVKPEIANEQEALEAAFLKKFPDGRRRPAGMD